MIEQSTPVETPAENLSPKKRKQIENNAMPDDEFGELMFTRLMDSEAFFDTEEMMQIEKGFVENWGVTRRLALGILKNPGRKLHDIFQTDREHADEMVASYDNLSEYTKMLREFADLMESALARMMIAYCEMEDMEEIFEEGRRPEKEH